MIRLIFALFTLTLPAWATPPEVPRIGSFPPIARSPGRFVRFSSNGGHALTETGWVTVDRKKELERGDDFDRTPSTTETSVSPDGIWIASILGDETFKTRSGMPSVFPQDRSWTVVLAEGHSFSSVDFSPTGHHIALTKREYFRGDTTDLRYYTIVWDIRPYLPELNSQLLLLDQDGNPVADYLVQLAHELDRCDTKSYPENPGFYSIRVVTDSNGRAPLPVYKTGTYEAITYYVWPGHPLGMVPHPDPVWHTIYLKRDTPTLLQLFIGHIGADRIWTTSPLEDPSTSLQPESWGSLKHLTR